MKVYSFNKIMHFLTVVFVVLQLTFLFGCENKLWDETQETNTIQGYEKYLQKYPKSKYANEAQSTLEVLQFDKAKGENTLDSYVKFLVNYPDSRLEDNAKSAIEILQYDKVKCVNTIYGYEKFLDKYPQSKFADEIHSYIK